MLEESMPPSGGREGDREKKIERNKSHVYFTQFSNTRKTVPGRFMFILQYLILFFH